MESRHRKAFTMAEVLITLGIIGVVAAMTMPTLISSYRKHIVETKLEKFYSMMNQAIRMSEAQNGEFKDWPDPPSNDFNGLKTWYNTYLGTYIKTQKVTKDSNLTIFLPDGSKFCFALGNPDHVYYYPNANVKNPQGGKDTFMFYLNAYKQTNSFTKNKFEPYKYGWNGNNVEDLKTNQLYGCNNTASHNYAYCAAWIQANGWKIPKDYPIKF